MARKDCLTWLTQQPSEVSVTREPGNTLTGVQA